MIETSLISVTPMWPLSLAVACHLLVFLHEAASSFVSVVQSEMQTQGDTVSTLRRYCELTKNMNLQHTNYSTPVPYAVFWVQVEFCPHFVSSRYEVGHSMFKMSMQENNAKKLVVEKIHMQSYLTVTFP